MQYTVERTHSVVNHFYIGDLIYYCVVCLHDLHFSIELMWAKLYYTCMYIMPAGL